MLIKNTFLQKKTLTLWRKYIDLMIEGKSLRKIVEKMDEKINLKTAFYLKHKVL